MDSKIHKNDRNRESAQRFERIRRAQQSEVDTDKVNEETAKFLQDGMEVSIEFYDEKPMTVNPPENLVAEIAETEAVVKGQTASSSYKPALLTNGVRVTVPPHIETGDKIKISTKELTYIEKSK